MGKWARPLWWGSALLNWGDLHLVLHKLASAKNIVGSLERCHGWHRYLSTISAWLRFCASTVVTNYNFRVYRINQVHFDMNPFHTFAYHQRGGSDVEKFVEITYAKLSETFHEKSVTFERRPLLEAYPEKAQERVFLLPEVCCTAGVTDEMRQETEKTSPLYKGGLEADQSLPTGEAQRHCQARHGNGE